MSENARGLDRPAYQDDNHTEPKEDFEEERLQRSQISGCTLELEEICLPLSLGGHSYS